jgi:hypothetical protein
MAITQLRWKSAPQKKEWSNQENAEFYRIAHMMERAGLVVDIEHGVSDEGDPWLVFVRPDTGDVIAHFAKLDNRFVSVSALTQDIFEGANVRAVVDQMLERHPFMIPRSGPGGKLFLHPGVVLSAFVAAAYFMVADSARAGTIEKILSEGLLSKEQEASIKSDDQNQQYIDKFLSERNVISRTTAEENTSFSQMAVLGAILRLKEIFSDEQSFESSEVSFVAEDMLSNEYSSNGTVGSSWLGNNNYSFVRQDENDYKLTVKLDGMSEVSSQGDSERYDSGFEANKGHWIDLLGDDLIWGGEEQGLIEMSALKTFEEGFEYQTPISIDEFGLLDSSASRLGAEKSNGNEAWSLSDAIDIQALVTDAREVFDSLLANGIGSNSGLIEGIGLVVGTDGEVTLVALNTNNLSELIEVQDIIVLEQDHNSVSAADLVTAGVMQQPSEEQLSSTIIQEADPAGLNKEILVHQVRTEGIAELTLTKATDIILYWGGDLVVEGFEFGQDLFWFFSSHEKIGPSSGQIIDEADLQISFGLGNTLTFVDVVGSSGVVEIG